MIKLTFVLLDDVNSKNTINILKYLNTHIGKMNELMYFVELLLLNKTEIGSENFKSFRIDNDVQSIPAVIISSDTKKKTISTSNGVAVYLEQILNANVDPAIGEIESTKETTDKNYDTSDSESGDVENMDKYLTSEICNRGYDNGNLLSCGHDDDALMKKLKAYNSRKNVSGQNDGATVINKNNQAIVDKSHNDTKTASDVTSDNDGEYENKLNATAVKKSNKKRDRLSLH